jgi:hypothetical protein
MNLLKPQYNISTAEGTVTRKTNKPKENRTEEVKPKSVQQ